MNNKNIVFNERRQTQTATYCMILFIENSIKDKTEVSDHLLGQGHYLERGLYEIMAMLAMLAILS